ncbi:MAG: hypothetical protein MJ252_06490 [archaeon]|nr:hypothetical protein [archaeon]
MGCGSSMASEVTANDPSNQVQNIPPNECNIEFASRRLLADGPAERNQSREVVRVNLISRTNELGKFQKERLYKDMSENPNMFVPVEDALKDEKGDFFKMGILARSLESQGVTTAIRRTADNPEIAQANLQVLFGGMSTKRKLDVEFDQSLNKSALESTKKSVVKSISKRFNIPEAQISLGDPVQNRERGTITHPIILETDIQIELVDETLKKIREDIPHISHISLLSLLEGIELTPEMFDERGDNEGKGWAPPGEKRGPPGKQQEYLPPYNWRGFGLNVYDIYDCGNNDWLNYENVPGEWWVAYHGIKAPISVDNAARGNNQIKFEKESSHEGEPDLNHPGEKIKSGVLVSPDPEVALKYCKAGIAGKNYFIAFMCRVNPDLVQICKNHPKYWIVPGDISSIRPYRLLIHMPNQ